MCTFRFYLPNFIHLNIRQLETQTYEQQDKKGKLKPLSHGMVHSEYFTESEWIGSIEICIVHLVALKSLAMGFFAMPRHYPVERCHFYHLFCNALFITKTLLKATDRIDSSQRCKPLV